MTELFEMFELSKTKSFLPAWWLDINKPVIEMTKCLHLETIHIYLLNFTIEISGESNYRGNFNLKSHREVIKGNNNHSLWTKIYKIDSVSYLNKRG